MKAQLESALGDVTILKKENQMHVRKSALLLKES